MTERYVGIDFGGSNLRIAEVNPENGDLIGDVFTKSLDDVISDEALCHVVAEQIPSGAKVGISAAGDVAENSCVIRLSPNSKIKGQITFGRFLLEKGHDVVMTNDMKAAVCAAATFEEEGKSCNRVLIATYSSGYNCAVAEKRKVVTTAEFGHLWYGPGNDNNIPCGCGGFSHLETAVSGNGASYRARKHLVESNEREHPILLFALNDLNKKAEINGGLVYEKSELSSDFVFEKVLNSVTSKHVYQAHNALPGDQPQMDIWRIQKEAIAVSFGMMNSAYNPLDIMVLMGSQTNDWDDLFVPAMHRYETSDPTKVLQLPNLPHPTIVRTTLPQIGVQGAVAYYLSRRRKD